MNNNELLLVGGSAHPELNEAVAKELGIELVNLESGNHPDTETWVKIFDNARDSDAYVLQPTGRSPGNTPEAGVRSVDENSTEARAILRTLRQASARRITLITPYFAYGRSDRQDDTDKYRNPIMAKLEVDLFRTAGAERFLAFDLHADQIQGFTDEVFENIHARKVFASFLREAGVVTDPVIASPDTGAAKMIDKYADGYGTDDIAIVHKRRHSPKETSIAAVIGDVAGRDVIIADDIVSTGGSLVKAAEALKDRGASKVIASITHGVLSGNAVEVIEESDALEHLYITDTLPCMRGSDKITRVSIAPLLASAITNMYTGKSVRTLSDNWPM